MKSLSIEQQIDVLRPSVTSGIAAHFHHWFLAGAAIAGIAAVVLWHPVPLVIALFLGFVGLAEQKAGPNIVAALNAYDLGTPTPGKVSVTFTDWSDDCHYHVTVHEQGQVDWKYEFVPQGWQPAAQDYAARIWRIDPDGQPVLVTVEDGILIPRYVPTRIEKTG